MFCSKVLITIDRPRLNFRTRCNNRPCKTSSLKKMHTQVRMRKVKNFHLRGIYAAFRRTQSNNKIVFNLECSVFMGVSDFSYIAWSVHQGVGLLFTDLTLV